MPSVYTNDMGTNATLEQTVYINGWAVDTETVAKPVVGEVSRCNIVSGDIAESLDGFTTTPVSSDLHSDGGSTVFYADVKFGKRWYQLRERLGADGEVVWRDWFMVGA